MKEQRKIEILQAVCAGKIQVSEAAIVMARSERTIYRLCSRLSTIGLTGIVHGNKGRASPKKLSTAIVDNVLLLAQEKYADVNDTHMTELLAKHEDIKISRGSLRRILRNAGIGAKRKRRKGKYRSRRERKEAMGMMLQIDGSPHNWLEDRGPWLTLVGAKDDATGYVWARFFPTETTWSYLEVLEDICLSHGVPLSLYSDRHTIFHSPRDPTILEQIKNIRPLTQFGRAMNELEVQIIKAYSPQAKGRVERQWGVFQDRLVVELRLAGINTMDGANQLLKGFLLEYNQQFSVQAKQEICVFRRSPGLEELQRILCLKDQRVVNKDHTISFEGLILQIPYNKNFSSLAKRKVDVLQLKDGRIEIVHQNKPVATFSAAAVSRMIDNYAVSKTELKKAEMKIN